MIRSKSFYTPTETVSVSTVSLSIFSSTASCNGHGSKYCTDNNQLLFAKNKSLRLKAWVYNHTGGPRLLISCDTIQYHCIGNTIQYDYIKAYRCLPNLNKSKKFCENPSQSASGPRKKFSLKVKERKCSQLTAGLRAASNQTGFSKELWKVKIKHFEI